MLEMDVFYFDDDTRILTYERKCRAIDLKETDSEVSFKLKGQRARLFFFD